MNSKNSMNKTNLHFNTVESSEDSWAEPNAGFSNTSQTEFADELFPETFNFSTSGNKQTSHTNPHSDRLSGNN